MEFIQLMSRVVLYMNQASFRLLHRFKFQNCWKYIGCFINQTYKKAATSTSSGFYLQTRKAKTLCSVIIKYQDSIKKVRMALNDSGKRRNRLSRVADFCYRTFRISQAFKLLLHAVWYIEYVNFAVTCNQIENLASKRLL